MNIQTGPVVVSNYESGDDLKIGTRQIKIVEFDKSHLEKIPDELLNHKEIQNVSFHSCSFFHVRSLTQLTVCRKLTELTIKECKLKAFPDVLCELDTLKSLNLSGNYFAEGLPSSLQNLRNLETLDLSSCGLRKFPLVISYLNSLKILSIMGNKIQSLGESITTSLEILNASRCGLTEFPQVLCKLKSLRELQIERNRIQDIPETLENLRNMETLNISFCGLTEFPQVLCKLQSMRNLQIGWNAIKNIPES